MSSATQYHSVPTTSTRTYTTSRCASTLYSAAACGAFLCIVAGIPSIVYGVLQYVHANKFSEEPSSCRINAIGKESGRWRVGREWNVDIVKQSNSNNSRKELVVLRSDLKISYLHGFDFSSSVSINAANHYSVSTITICNSTLLPSTFEKKWEVRLQLSFQFSGWQNLPVLSLQAIARRCYSYYYDAWNRVKRHYSMGKTIMASSVFLIIFWPSAHSWRNHCVVNCSSALLFIIINITVSVNPASTFRLLLTIPVLRYEYLTS